MPHGHCDHLLAVARSGMHYGFPHQDFTLGWQISLYQRPLHIISTAQKASDEWEVERDDRPAQ
jgi:hypothetical protein